MSGNKSKRKNSVLALILSAVLPGLGQIYNSQIVKGLLLLALNFGISYLIREPLALVLGSSGPLMERPDIFLFLAYGLAGTVLVVVSMIDAKQTADMINKETGPP